LSITVLSHCCKNIVIINHLVKPVRVMKVKKKKTVDAKYRGPT